VGDWSPAELWNDITASSPEELWDLVLLKADPDFPLPMSTWLYATFFTSFWLWLSALAAIVLRFGQLMAWTRRLFTWAVRIDEKPFRAVGVVVLGIETVVFSLLAVIVGARSIWQA
jgi:hypothetical protein